VMTVLAGRAHLYCKDLTAKDMMWDIITTVLRAKCKCSLNQKQHWKL